MKKFEEISNELFDVLKPELLGINTTNSTTAVNIGYAKVSDLITIYETNNVILPDEIKTRLIKGTVIFCKKGAAKREQWEIEKEERIKKEKEKYSTRLETILREKGLI